MILQKSASSTPKSFSTFEEWQTTASSEMDETELSISEHSDTDEGVGQHIKPSSFSKPTSRGRFCVCCHVTSTPLWRDAGHGRVLCNACGIRFKKYGLFCNNCSVRTLLVSILSLPHVFFVQYVPCKNERDSKICRRCQSMLPSATKKSRVYDY